MIFLADQQKRMNDLTAQEYLDSRKAYTGKTASTADAREEYADELLKSIGKLILL